MATRRGFHDEFLHEYLDGELDAQTHAAVARELEDAAADRAAVESYRAQQRLLHRYYDGVLDEAVPERLTAVIGRHAQPHTAPGADKAPAGQARSRLRQSLLATAAAVVLLMVGGAGGWIGRGQLYGIDARQAAIDSFLQHAANSYALYGDSGSPWSSDSMHDPDKFTASFQKSAGVKITAPRLEKAGWQFVGGRALPSSTGPAGQLIYRDKRDQRVVVYFQISRGDSDGLAVSGANPAGEAAQSLFTKRNDLSVYYWDDGGVSYALLGKLKKGTLSALVDSFIGTMTT